MGEQVFLSCTSESFMRFENAYAHPSNEACRKDDDVARDQPIAFGMMHLSSRVLSLRLNNPLKQTTSSENAVEIGTEETMDEGSIILFDRSLTKIVSNRNLAFFLPP